MGHIVQAAALLAAAATTVLAQEPPKFRDVDPAVFPSITPSETLTWHDCYEKFKCARFKVPANVEKKKSKDTVELAVVKLPALAGTSNGTIHFNAGGWSSSSTNFVVKYGEAYQGLFPAYDLLALDFRGAGWSTPSFNCFENEEERQTWLAGELPLLGTGKDDNFWARYDRAETFAKKCKKNAGKVGKYMGTYPTAVDHYKVMKADGREKMSFWGSSSGTHVGHAIAALYPEVVDKFMLDAPLASDQVFDVSFAQASSIQGAEKGMDAFYYTCIETNCPFKGNSTTVAELKERFEALDEKLQEGPVQTNGTSFTWSDLRRFQIVFLHEGSFFPLVGPVFAELEAGFIGEATQMALGFTYADKEPALPILDMHTQFEALTAGICNDEKHHIKSVRGFFKYFKDLTKKVPSIASHFADYRLSCMEWRISPVNVFPKKFKKTKVAGDILYITNIADPSCSSENAEHMSELLYPSYIVKNNAVGHTFFAQSAESNCLYGVIYPFFNLGVNPAPGTVCEPNKPALNITLPAGF